MIGRRAVAALLVALLVGAVSITVASFRRADPEGWVHVGLLPQLAEAEVTYVEDHRVFVVVAEGRAPLALSAIDPHLGHRNLYCPRSEQFEGAHGEKFDKFGSYFGGPAPRGLDRVEIRTNDEIVEINPTIVLEGPPRREPKSEEPVGQFCNEGAPEEPAGFLQVLE